MTKLLLIDDDILLCSALRRGLAADGFTVETAHDGDDGLWRATESRYDLIVLDIMLPGRNGYRVCSALRDAGLWTPVLMLTAKDGDLDEAEALEGGADDYLTKPFSYPVLLARIRALLRRAGGRDPAPLVAQGLVVDPAGQRASFGGEAIALTAREFQLLEFFLRRAGAVVSKSDILAGVWADCFDGDPNIVEVYVRRLRRKIDERFSIGLITTIRGAGYRLEAE